MNNLKKLMETRNSKIEEMQSLINNCEREERALNEEEQQQYKDLRDEISNLDNTIKAMEEMRNLEGFKPAPDGKSDQKEKEIREFANYIRGVKAELRAGEQNFTKSNNGVLIPVTIADEIVKTIKDKCPIFELSKIMYANGVLRVPVYGPSNTSHQITMAYADDFATVTPDAGAFSSVELKGYVARAITLIGRSMALNSDIDLVSFVVEEVAEQAADFIERELLVGKGNNSACTGAINTTNTVTAAAGTAITADELIDLQAAVKQAYQSNAVWIMNPATFAAIRKLKDGNQRYILQDDFASEFPYRMLGKPVYVSDNMPTIEAGAKAVLYGDMTGLGVKIAKNIDVQILNERYAELNAIGVQCWIEIDSKVINSQKIAALVMGA